MHSNNCNGSRAAWARGFVALFAMMLAMGLVLAASPAEAAPFAYVTNNSSTVSVIDTATNKVVATVPVGVPAFGVAVAPDGKHVYVADGVSKNVLVIATATNTVVARVAVGSSADGVAVTPDGTRVYAATAANGSVIATATNKVVARVRGGGTGSVAVTSDGKHAYVTNQTDNTVSVIDTGTNVAVATIGVGTAPTGIAVTPDGTQVYVANENPFGSGTVSVIATATNMVAATVPVELAPLGVAVTPDGKHAYVTNVSSFNVSVIDTGSNAVVATVPVGANPAAVAVAPDGKHAYVANAAAGNVSVIDTASNTVEAATITVGNEPVAVGIVPPPAGVPFLAFNANLDIAFGTAPNQDAFTLGTSFTLSSTAPAIRPVTDTVMLQAGTFAITIPPGSFSKQPNGSFTFAGVIGGVTLKALLKPTGTLRYAFRAEGMGASFTGTQNTVYVTLTVGGDSGATSVTAQISGTSSVTAGISP